MLNQDICNFHNAHAVYAAYGGIVFAEEEGNRIAEALGKHNKVRHAFHLAKPLRSCFVSSQPNRADLTPWQAAILMSHGLLSCGSTVDEAGFLFGLLDRGCAIQLQVEAACAGNPHLKKHIISDEEAAYNFKMASEKNALYADAQPDVEFQIETAGLEVLARGVEGQVVDGY